MSIEQNPSHIYENGGQYTVRLTVIGPAGYDIEQKVNYITVDSIAAPVSEFTVSDETPTVGYTISFTDLSTGNITSWLWDFGDGNTSSDQNPTHDYSSTGTYTVALTTTGPGGSHTETKTDYIVVAELPAANFTINNYSPTPGETITFTDTSFTLGTITSWSWNFGDGNTSTNQNPTNNYTLEGSYTVSLEVTDEYGSDIETKTGIVNVISVSGSVGDYGYAMGGYSHSISQNISIIDRITFPFNSGTASNVGNLSGIRSNTCGCNSSQYGYSMGGSSENFIDRIIFPFDSGTATWVGIMLVESACGGCNSSQYGYCMGNDVYASSSIISRIIFPFNSGTSDSVGNLERVKIKTVGCNSSQHGYAMGGFQSTYVGDIERITFPFDSGTASWVGNLTNIVDECAACNSSQHGYCMGGYNSSGEKSTIDRITFPFDSGGASHVGDLSGSRFRTAGCNSSQYGYCMGVLSGSIIDRLTFPFDSGTATHVGNLSVSSCYKLGSCDETDFNTQFMDISVDFSGTPTIGSQGTSVDFSSSSTGFIDTYLWNFGDGNTSTSANPSHTYNMPNQYDVSLTVTNTINDDVETKTDYITINVSGTTVGDYGYIMGGSGRMDLSIFYHSTIDRIMFPFDFGTATHVGNLSGSRFAATGCNSSQYGYCMGGDSIYAIYTNIDRITFPFNSGVTTSIGNLSESRHNSSGCNSSQYGYCMGGYKDYLLSYSTIDRITFPFDSGDASDIGNLSGSRYAAAGCNSSQHGYCMGGFSSTQGSVIDRITFPFDSGTSDPVGNLNGDRTGVSGCNSSQHGYCMLTVLYPLFSIIDRITFPFDSGTADMVGNLSETRQNSAGCNSSQHGYCMGGNNPYANGDLSTIIRIIFPFDSGTVTHVGYLSEIKHSSSICDETDFNTMFMDLSAEFTGTPTITGIGTTVDFTNASGGFVDTYSWTFEGGTPAASTDENPTITYNSEGTYDVSLTVANTINNNIKTKVDYINVINEWKLIADDGQTDDDFGTSVSIDGNFAIVGAYLDDNENGSNAGAAYIFEYNSSTNAWTQHSKLLASDGVAGDYFGWSVAIDGNFAIVGAYHDDNENGVDAGAAYIFEYDSGTDTWIETQKLLASDGVAVDYFGYSVAIDGNFAIVSAYYDDNKNRNVGAAYIFEYNSGTNTWIETQKLLSPDGVVGNYFGSSVSIDGNFAIVGAYYDTNENGVNIGAAYIFEYNSGTNTWIETQKLLASDGVDGDDFGTSIAIDGNFAIVGANNNNNENGVNAGAAYIFEYNSGTNAWTQTQKLLASDGVAGDYFGWSVAIDGNFAIVGAKYVAYVFEYNSGTNTWAQHSRLLASDGDVSDYFGTSIAIDGNFAIVGAHLDDNENGVDAGAAYVYRVSDDPNADFEVNNVTPVTGETVIFTNNSTSNGTISSYAWTFEGGTPATSTSASPTVTWDTAGTYDVSLTVTDQYGDNTELKLNYITVGV